MAVKSLTSLVGSQHELGDILRTKRTTLPDGRSLIACDGNITVSKPLLDAVLTTGVHIARATQVKSSALVVLKRAEKWDMSDTNDIFIGISSEGSSELEHVDDGGTLASSIITGASSDVAISADGVTSYVLTIETTSLDLEIVSNGASGIPATAKDIDTGQDYSTTSAVCLISNNGLVCKIIAQSTNEDINVWTSTDGPNGTWSEITPINPAAAGTRGMLNADARGNSTLSDMVVGTTKGLWISDDTGATWTEDIVLPTGDDPNSIAITEAGVIYAVDSVSETQVYTTTDKGSTWTVLFDLSDHPNIATAFHSNILLTHVEVDSSDNIYVIGYSVPHAAAPDKQSLHLWYSADAGATWVYSNTKFLYRPSATGTLVYPVGLKDLRVNAAGTVLAYAVNTGTDLDYIMKFVITQGKFPPFIEDADWKMVAD